MIRLSTSSLAALAALTLAFAAGCGRSKVEQCNALIDRANKAQGAVQAANLDSDDPAAIEAAAGKVEAEAKGINEVALEDQKLVEFRGRYGQALTDFAKAMRELSALVKTAKDPAKAAGAEAQLKKLEASVDAAAKAESKVVDEVNAYCSGK